MKNSGFVALITVISMMTFISLLTFPLFVRTATVYQYLYRNQNVIRSSFLNQSAQYDHQLKQVHENN